MSGVEATIIKGGSMLATGGLVADLIIFNDPAYIALSVVGAVVSVSGVIHEISNRGGITIWKALGEVLKGFVLGFLAIPFWYLLLSDIGNSLAQKIFDFDGIGKIGKSVWLMVSFGMAWYTVPIFNWMVMAVVSIMNFLLKRFVGGIK